MIKGKEGQGQFLSFGGKLASLTANVQFLKKKHGPRDLRWFYMLLKEANIRKSCFKTSTYIGSV